jgi:hypothetical protein
MELSSALHIYLESLNKTVDKTCSLLHYPLTKIHIQWGSREDRKPAIDEIAGFAFIGQFGARLGVTCQGQKCSYGRGHCQSLWTIRGSQCHGNKEEKKPADQVSG